MRGPTGTAGARAPRLAGLWTVLTALTALSGVLAGCNGMFFQPDSQRYWQPEQFKLRYEEVTFPSGDGPRLHGWFLPAEGTPRGTFVYFHGNGANISNHLPIVRWLPAAGYSVLTFDYRGYGRSTGTPTRAGLIADGIAALDYVRSRPDVDPERLIVFGQSLGGAIAVGSLARADRHGVRALILEGGFGSYREVARQAMNGYWLTWPLQYPAAYLLITDALRPLDDLPAIAELPLLVIHSHTDTTVPFANGERLFRAFPGPDKTLWTPEQVPHIGTFVPEGSPWRERLLDYLAARMPPPGPAR